MKFLSLVVPRPVCDLYAGYKEFSRTERDLSHFGSYKQQFMALTIERLLLAGVAAGAVHYCRAPKWLSYGTMAVISLPAAIVGVAGELTYQGLSALSLVPSQLSISALMIGGGLLLFEKYDRLSFNGHSVRCYYALSEDICERYNVWVNRMSTRSYECLGLGIGEPGLDLFNDWLFP